MGFSGADNGSGLGWAWGDWGAVGDGAAPQGGRRMGNPNDANDAWETNDPGEIVGGLGRSPP